MESLNWTNLGIANKKGDIERVQQPAWNDEHLLVLMKQLHLQNKRIVPAGDVYSRSRPDWYLIPSLGTPRNCSAALLWMSRWFLHIITRTP